LPQRTRLALGEGAGRAERDDPRTPAAMSASRKSSHQWIHAYISQRRRCGMQDAYNSSPEIGFRIEGESGNLHLQPAFGVQRRFSRNPARNRTPTMFIPKTPVGDQFAAEMDDSPACIIDGNPTRTPGEEGLADMKVIEALYKSAAEKKPVKL